MKKSTVVSVIGLLTMFVAFVLFQTWPLVLFGTVKTHGCPHLGRRSHVYHPGIS